MPELNVWIKSVPQTWFKLQDKFRDTVAGNVIVDARRSVRVNDPSGPQVDSYAIRVFRYLQEMFDRVAGACGGSAFKTVSVHADTPEARWVTNTDLLCYVMQTTNMSSIPRQIEAHRQFGDQAGADQLREKYKTNLQIGGMTYPVFQGGVFRGICSEVWCDTAGIINQARGTANAIMHELMHNKSRWQDDLNNHDPKYKPDSDWPHVTGGGGLAAANADASIARLTDVGALALCKRLGLSNQQFVGGL